MTAAASGSSSGSSGPVIEVENVSRRFTIGAAQQQQSAGASDLREAFSSWMRFRRRRDGAEGSAELPPSREFWALKDVSFTVEPGTSLGIIGHNGSGKSTLLKLLTGIMKPTSGHLRTRGRIGALIEVGAGFHPELSGRENIFLNGSILGLSRKEIERKFDDIVAFAGLERFIDTPVKRYSSGMYMRLGFSIAAHVEPDILLIDEVMAVGDTQFQRKCIARMREFVAQGGAVIFVAHSMSLIAEVCPRTLWLDHGQLRYDGDSETAIEQYMAVVAAREDEEFKRNHPEEWAMREQERREAEEARRRAEEQEHAERERVEAERKEAERRAIERQNDPTQPSLLGVTLRDADGQERTRFRAGEPVTVRIGYRLPRPRANTVIGFEIIRSSDDLYMFAASNYQYDVVLPGQGHGGEEAAEFHIPFLALNEGTYRLRLSLFPEPDRDGWDRQPEHALENAVTFTVSAGVLAHGCVLLPVEWNPDMTVAAAAAVPSARTAVVAAQETPQ